MDRMRIEVTRATSCCSRPAIRGSAPTFESWMSEAISVLDAVGATTVDVISHNEAPRR